MADDKHWAQGYLIDPLIAPDPSSETGPGTHFRSTFAPASTFTPSPPPSAASPASSPAISLREQLTGTSVYSNAPTYTTNPPTYTTNPFRRSLSVKAHHTASSSASYPTPPSSTSPRASKFPEFDRNMANTKQSSSGEPSARPRPRRTSSLSARFPGDETHRPLDMIRRDSKKAHRSPHLQRKHIPGADMIDRLDVHAYHHEGPYDAVLMSRNTDVKSSPLAAVARSNAEALKATPRENIQDSLLRHRPLEGTASIPPGVPDQFGRVYNYEEGTDMMRELEGNYKRWPGMPYAPDDLKGKGEPSFTIDKALKDHKAYGDGIEMQPRRRPRNKSVGHVDFKTPLMDDDYVVDSSGVRRSHTTGKRVAEGLKKRFGSLRKRKE